MISLFFGLLWIFVGLLQENNPVGVDVLSVKDLGVTSRRQRGITSSSVQIAREHFFGVESKSGEHNANTLIGLVQGDRPEPDAEERMNSSLLENINTNVRSQVLDLLGQSMKAELRVDKSMQELWWYVRAKLSEMKAKNGVSDVLRSQLNIILTDAGEQYRVLSSHVKEAEKISDTFHPVDKTEVSRKLGELLQRRLHYLQNPSNCSKAKKLVCNLSKTCGFGCQIHHVTYCFIMAYATERTLLLTSRGWQYASEGWESAFMPLSETCTTEDIQGNC